MNILLLTFSSEEIYLEYCSYSLNCLKAFITKDKELSDMCNIHIKYYHTHVTAEEQERQKKEIIDFIKGNNITILGLGVYIWNIKLLLSLSREIKQIFPEIKIILGGPQVMDKPEEMIKNNNSIDIIVIGDGELAFSELVRHFVYSDKRLDEIKGLSYRLDGMIKKTAPRAIITGLDTIPSPYLTGLIKIKKGYVYPLESSRGCLFKCAYCHWGINKLRFFSLERIKKELDFIISNKASIGMFVDSAINFDNHRAHEIINFINKYNKETLFTMFQSIYFLNEKFIELLNNSYSIHTEIGIQSLNPEALKNINRAVLKKEKLKILRLMKRPFTVDLIYGLPGDNFETFRETFEEVFKYTRNISFFRLGVHPGTSLWEKQEQYNIKLENENSTLISNYSYKKEDVDKTLLFIRNYEEIFLSLFSDFTSEEIFSLSPIGPCYFINNYSDYLRANYSDQYINKLKFATKEEKIDNILSFQSFTKKQRMKENM